MKKVLLYLSAAIIVYLFLNPYYLYPDGQGYFAYLPSLFFDRDLDLFNNFTQMRIPTPLALTDTGYIANNWSFGSAMFWAPFYVAAKLLASLGENPYSSWFWFWISFSTILYGISAFYLSKAALKHSDFTFPNKSILPLAAFAGTPMLFYTFTVSTTSHVITAFLAAAFVWYWLGSLNSAQQLKRHIVLGLLLGLNFTVRPQEAVYGIIVFVEMFFVFKTSGIKSIAKNLTVFAFAFIFAAMPQFLVWKIMYGSFYYAPSKFNLSLNYFDLKNVLFSSYHGLLAWTPVYLVALVGLIAGSFKKPKLYLGLLAAFMAQLLVNACCIAFWEGYSFGLRQMTSLYIIVVFGLAGFMFYAESYVKNIKVRWLIVLVPCLWSLGLFINQYAGLDLLGYISYKELFKFQFNPSNLLVFVKRVANLPHAQLNACFAMAITAFVFFFAFNKAKNTLEKNNFTFTLSLIAVFVISFNVLILYAHNNKPAIKEERAGLVKPAQLDEFFLGQVNDMKKKYGIK